MESRTKNKKSREVIEAMVKRSFNDMGLAGIEDDDFWQNFSSKALADTLKWLRENN